MAPRQTDARFSSTPADCLTRGADPTGLLHRADTKVLSHVGLHASLGFRRAETGSRCFLLWAFHRTDCGPVRRWLSNTARQEHTRAEQLGSYGRLRYPAPTSTKPVSPTSPRTAEGWTDRDVRIATYSIGHRGAAWPSFPCLVASTGLAARRHLDADSSRKNAL